MTKLNIQYRDPNQLSVHPTIKHIPALGEDELKPIRAGMKYAGEAMQPILVDEEGWILSDTGRTAWLCAKARQLKEVPVCICAAADVHLIVIRDLAHDHRHLSKSAIAYLAVPHLQPALDAARLKRLENLRKGQEIPVSVLSADSGVVTMMELAEELGICCSMLEKAILVRKEFLDKKIYTWSAPGTAEDGTDATFKDWYEPKLLRSFVGGEHESKRPVGLGGILAGIESKKLDPADCNPKKTPAQMELKLWEESFQPLNKVAPSWKQLSDEDRASVLKHWQRTVNKMPDDLRAAMAAILEKSIKA